MIRPEDTGRILVAVIDALGHGPDASSVADAAAAFISSSASSALDELMRGCHRRLEGTRGAAIALARIDSAAGHLCYCGVGNVEARLIGSVRSRPISYSGIVGTVLPRLRVFEFPFRQDDLLLMHTDGISARFDLVEYADLTGLSAQLIAETIARDWSRARDDATIVVVRHTGDSA